MILLFRYLRTIYPLSEGLRNRIEDTLQEKKLARREYLLRAGQICRNVYFVEKGLLRNYYTKGGKDISAAFLKEGDVCTAVGSFFTQQCGPESIQAIEESMLYYIPYVELKRIYQDFVEFNFIGRILLEKCYLSKLHWIQAMWMQPAQDRYNWLVEQFPELVQRVPAKYLASYIGITEGMLSNIKGSRLTKKAGCKNGFS